MIIIAGGWGVLLPIVVFAALLVSQSIEDALKLSTAEVGAMLTGLVALLCWFGGRYVNREAAPGIKRAHHFFFIALEWWALPLGVFYLLLTAQALGLWGPAASTPPSELLPTLSPR